MTPAEKLLKESVSFLDAGNTLRLAKYDYKDSCNEFEMEVADINHKKWIAEAIETGVEPEIFTEFKVYTKPAFEAVKKAKNDLKNAKSRFETAARNYKHSVK